MTISSEKYLFSLLHSVCGAVQYRLDSGRTQEVSPNAFLANGAASRSCPCFFIQCALLRDWCQNLRTGTLKLICVEEGNFGTSWPAPYSDMPFHAGPRRVEGLCG